MISKASQAATLAVSEAIKELHQVPSGHLYAQLMPYMSFEAYTEIISILKESGVIAEDNYMLEWVGTPKPALTEKEHNQFPKGRW